MIWHFVREDGRAYQLEVSADLFGGWRVIRRWGGTRRGLTHQQSHHLDARAAVEPVIAATIAKRLKRGYSLTEAPDSSAQPVCPDQPRTA